MNKRLRKKLRLGEFVEYGFSVQWKKAPGSGWIVEESFLEALEAKQPGLLCGGGEDAKGGEFFFTFCEHCQDRAKRYRPRSKLGPLWLFAHRSRSSCTEAHREAVRAMFATLPAVTDFTVGPLVDAWRCTESDFSHVGSDGTERHSEGLHETFRLLVEAGERYLAAHPGTPPLYESGVRYVRSDREAYRDIAMMLETGQGDVDELVCWRIAELRRQGIDAKPELVKSGTSYVVRVRLPDGSIENMQERVKR